MQNCDVFADKSEKARSVGILVVKVPTSGQKYFSIQVTMVTEAGNGWQECLLTAGRFN